MGISFEIHKRLDHFSLDIEYAIGNEFLVIEGPSGAGKTTILNCISGIILPDRGRIILKDEILFDRNADDGG